MEKNIGKNVYTHITELLCYTAEINATLKSTTLKKSLIQDFPSSLMVKTLCFYCRGDRFDPWSGKFHMPCGTAKKEKKTV